MSIQILPEAPSFASSFGKGIGGGLSEQLPEEIKRYRLKSGLTDIADLAKSQKPPTQYELISRLAAIPGLDQGLLGVIAPALLTQFRREEQGGQSALPVRQPLSSTTQAAQEVVPRRENRQGYLEKSTADDILRYAEDLSRDKPFSFPTAQDAIPFAEKFLNREFETDVAYQQKQDAFRGLVKKDLESFLQKTPEEAQGELSGIYTNYLENAALDDLARPNVNMRKVSREYAQKAYDMTQKLVEMRKIKDSWNLSGAVDNLRDFGQFLEKNGMPADQVIDKISSTQNISKQAASFILDPIKEGATANYLRSLAPLTISKSLGKGRLSKNKEIAARLSKLLKPEDQIGSLAYVLKAKGYDYREILTDLDGLSDLQRSQRSSAVSAPTSPTLSEVYLMKLGGGKKQARGGI